MEACVDCCMGQVSLAIQHLLFGIVLLTIKVEVLLFDAFEFVVLCAEHVDIGYDPRVPKVVEGIIDNKAGGTAGIEDGVMSVLDTWTVEVGGGVRACMERSAINGLVFAFCSLVDNTVID